MDGNARALSTALPVRVLALKVRGATHLDAESPTDLLRQLACGWSDPRRRAIFRRYAIAFLKTTLTDDQEAWRTIDGAATDAALTEVDLGPREHAIER